MLTLDSVGVSLKDTVKKRRHKFTELRSESIIPNLIVRISPLISRYYFLSVVTLRSRGGKIFPSGGTKHSNKSVSQYTWGIVDSGYLKWGILEYGTLSKQYAIFGF